MVQLNYEIPYCCMQCCSSRLCGLGLMFPAWSLALGFGPYSRLAALANYRANLDRSLSGVWGSGDVKAGWLQRYSIVNRSSHGRWGVIGLLRHFNHFMDGAVNIAAKGMQLYACNHGRCCEYSCQRNAAICLQPWTALWI